MMQTRCPACATAFRVTPEQLKAKHGKVRCGQCQHVFNALDSLLDALPAEPEPGSGPENLPEVTTDFPEPALTPSSVAPTVVAYNSNVIDEVAQPLDGFTENLAEEIATKAEPLAEPPASPAVEMPSLPPSPTVPEAVPASPIEFAAESAAESAESAEEPAEQSAANPAENLPAKTVADPVWQGQDGDLLQTEDRAAPPRRIWPWALATLLALLLLLVQVLVQFRVELALLSPTSKHALHALCVTLGCEIPLPQKADLLGIETSDLRPDPRNKGQLVLNVTLKNLAPFVQAYPALELTLTDTTDQALLRKVLAPAEYLPKNADASRFSANSELTLNLSLIPDVSVNATAAGYRLYLFYP